VSYAQQDSNCLKRPVRLDIVVTSYDRTFTYCKSRSPFDAIRMGARLVATNPDRYCPTPTGGEPDCAAMIAAIEACTGVKCDPIVGKPSPIMVATDHVASRSAP